jgi:hypothetical protein
VAEALAALPWVEARTIYADRATRQVRFAVHDRAAFDEAAVVDVVRRAGYRGARRLVGPTDPPPPKEPPP